AREADAVCLGAIAEVADGHVLAREPRLHAVEPVALEERAQRARAEVVEVLGRLAVKPVAAHEPAQPAAVVRRVERDQPARTEHPADLVERAAWVAQVLDRVVENDDVEVIARQIRGREIAAPNVEATEVALCGGERDTSTPTAFQPRAVAASTSTPVAQPTSRRRPRPPTRRSISARRRTTSRSRSQRSPR